MTAEPRRSLVIGYGNTLRRDDGIGWHVARALADDPRAAGVDVIEAHQLLPEHAEDLHRASVAVLVDARVDGAPPPSPGLCVVTRVRSAGAGSAGGRTGGDVAVPATHHCTPEALAALASRLYGSVPQVMLVGVGVAATDEGEGLTPALAAAVPSVVDLVLRLVDTPGTAAGGGYLLDNRHATAASRLRVLAALFDPGTFRRLTALGVGTGWRCWEVGAGGPSVPQWLAERSGPSGFVLATDLDVTLLGGGHADRYRVRRHDVGAEPPPGRDFDLVHARLVLAHVPQRSAALTSMAAALRPGGWLLVEDADPGLQPLVCLDESGPAQRLANKLKNDFRTLMASRGVDLSFGRTLPRLLRKAGLTEVGADGYFPVTGDACTALERATMLQIRDLLVDAGLATADEIGEHLDNIAAGVLDCTTSPMISAWGRKPPHRT